MMERKFYTFLLFCVFFYFNAIITKNILVTGGAGFIGSHVAQALLERGDTVFVVDNINDFYDPVLKYQNINTIKQSSSYNKDTFHFFLTDITYYDQLEVIFKNYKIDTICHLAARAGVQPSISNPQQYVDSNIVGTLNILEIARHYKIPHVVLASSSSVYGDSTKTPFLESDSVDMPCSPYAATKKASELFAYTYHNLHHISCTCLRFFTVYGPRGRVDMSPFKFLDAIDREKTLILCGDGSIIRDYTYVDDIVVGVLAALDTPLGFEIVNLGRGEPITLSSFISVIEEVVQKKAHIKHVPVSKGDVHITHSNIEKARNLLGYEPKTSVVDGMKKMYEWYLHTF